MDGHKFLTIFLFLVVAVVSSVALANTEKIHQLQDDNAKRNRTVDFRQCVRNDVTRAELQLDALNEPEHARGQNTVYAYQGRAPIVDCSVNLTDRGVPYEPPVLSRGEQTKYIHYLQTHNTPPKVRKALVYNTPEGAVP